jgi:ribosomal-protein-alanine N-acetyltransferase
MNYLKDFERHIALYDGMLIETGGLFAKGKLDGDKYEGKCLEIAKKYILAGGRRKELLFVIDKYILQYKDDKEWTYLDLEMSFLNRLKEKLGMQHRSTQPIDTQRLILRPFVINDCDDALANWAFNKKVQDEYGEPVYSTIAEVRQLIENWIKQYDNNDFFRWAIVEKQGGQNIGQIAFCKVYTDCKTAEIEYCIGENYWGNGYAGEALKAVIYYTFLNTDFVKLEAFHRAENTKSGRVLEKSSMKIVDNVERFKRDNLSPHGEVCYAITKDNFCT